MAWVCTGMAASSPWVQSSRTQVALQNSLRLYSMLVGCQDPPPPSTQ